MSFPKQDIAAAIAPTRKLFHDDAYQHEGEARVLWASGPYVVLDATLFYAESGGQEWDSGLLGGVAVIDVQDQGGRSMFVPGAADAVSTVDVETHVVHRLAADAPFAPGDRVSMQIDWERRYANMRNHSACHFMYAAIQRHCRGDAAFVPARGCHVYPEGSRMDFGADIAAEQIAEAEVIANALIAEDKAIAMHAEPTCPDLTYWTYGDLYIPCGGTHVRAAREVGPIKLGRKKKGAGLTRVTAQLVS